MKLDAALDTSATTTAICIVNSRDGAIVLETTVPTDPDAIARVLTPFLPRLHLVGHEATGWSAWLHRELESRDVPMVLLETHHTARMLEAQRNKTDKNDARGLAQLVRSGWFKPVHAKSDESNRLKLLLAHRRTLKRKLMDIENEVRQSLKMFGLMAGKRVQRASFPSRIRALVAGDPLLEGSTECMLRCWTVLWDEYRKLHALLVKLAGQIKAGLAVGRMCLIPHMNSRPAPKRRLALLAKSQGRSTASAPAAAAKQLIGGHDNSRRRPARPPRPHRRHACADPPRQKLRRPGHARRPRGRPHRPWLWWRVAEYQPLALRAGPRRRGTGRAPLAVAARRDQGARGAPSGHALPIRVARDPHQLPPARRGNP
jgi:transposase